MTIGILVKTLVGRRNQKRPTPKVKSVGKTRVIRVMFLPKPSLNDQIKSSNVKRLSSPILKNLYLSSTNCIPMNPRDKNMEVITKRFLFVRENLIFFNVFYDYSCSIVDSGISMFANTS